MRWRATQRLLGAMLVGYSSTLVPPLGVSLWYGDGEVTVFLISLILTVCVGLATWLPVRNVRTELRVRDGFIVVALFWTVLSLLSAVPFVLGPHLTFTAAVFEAVSGFTTTGATVISHIDGLPQSILFYRQQIQWLGGMGIVVLAVAVLPMLGVGGMQLYRAETPGPMKHEKLTPRIADTARILWIIYVALTIACALAFWAAGMSLFDAVGHSFSTLATGGFSTHDASLGYFDSAAIDYIAITFMFLGSINFGLHFKAFSGRTLAVYARDSEAMAFCLIIAVSVAVMTALLLVEQEYGDLVTAIRYAAFQVVSVITTTGFTTADFANWPSFLPIMLMYISYIGGSAGSTAGGIKVIRVVLLVKQIHREVFTLIHPRGVLPVKVGGKAVSETVLSAIWGFSALYAGSTAVLTLLFVWAGLDTLSAFSATSACLNLLGPGLGDVAVSFATTSPAAQWIGTFAMLLGRLEIFTLFVLLTPAFWRS
ncbi:MAG: potassium transporter [Gammaproteobacteria bacterium]|nr:potassium transporter [Gammaproteobacteria bacterium]